MTTLLHIFLNVTKSREQVHFSVCADRSQPPGPHVGLRGNTADVPISYDQPCPCAGNTLSEIILYACSVSVYTVHSITMALLQYAIFHVIFDTFIS